MTALPHQLILPSEACRQLSHQIETRRKQPGPGSYEYCLVCSMGYEMAIETMGDEAAADRFVETLRQ